MCLRKVKRILMTTHGGFAPFNEFSKCSAGDVTSLCHNLGSFRLSVRRKIKSEWTLASVHPNCKLLHGLFSQNIINVWLVMAFCLGY